MPVETARDLYDLILALSFPVNDLRKPPPQVSMRVKTREPEIFIRQRAQTIERLVEPQASGAHALQELPHLAFVHRLTPTLCTVLPCPPVLTPAEASQRRSGIPAANNQGNTRLHYIEAPRLTPRLCPPYHRAEPYKMPEQRAAPRQAQHLSLEITSEPEGRFEIRTLNISLCGAYCRSRYFLPLMTRLGVSLLLPEGESPRRLDAEAVVVRVQPSSESGSEGSYDVALYFTKMQPADQDQLSTFLKNNSGDGI